MVCKKKIKVILEVTFILGLLSCSSIYITLYYRTRHNLINNVFDMSLVEKMLYYYALCREYEYCPLSSLDYYSKLILHCTNTTNLFNTVEDLISKQGEWEWSNGNSMNESWNIMKYYFCTPGWNDQYFGLENIFDYFEEEIIPTEDMYISNYSIGDYIQSPIETMYRRKGDCEDYAILGASTFKTNGYEIMVALLNDKEVNITATEEFYESFNHAFYFVKLNNTCLYSNSSFWSFKGSNTTWLLVDIMWCNNFGGQPVWISAYSDRTTRYFEDWSDILVIKDVSSYMI